MAAKPTSALVSVRDRREEVIELLCDGYAQDLLKQDDFESRLDRAHQTTELAVLEEIVSDLEVAAPTDVAPVTSAATSQALIAPRKEKGTIVAIMGGLSRSGQWATALRNRVICLMGGIEIDLRDVDLAPGVTELNIYTVMGGVDVIVPPDVAVDCDGIAILGGFESKARAPLEPDANTPIVRIRGFVLMGGLEVSTRLRNESARQARKRRRREKRDLGPGRLPVARLHSGDK